MLEFVKIVSIEKNSFNDTWYAKVQFLNNGLEECRFIKFFGEPTGKQVTDKVDELIIVENTPISVDQLRQQKEELLRKEEEITKEIQSIDQKIIEKGETP